MLAFRTARLAPLMLVAMLGLCSAGAVVACDEDGAAAEPGPAATEDDVKVDTSTKLARVQ